MRSLTEQKQIEIRQDRREAIGILHFNHPVAKTRAHTIVLGSVRRSASKQASIVNAAQTAFTAGLVDDLHFLGVGQEDAHHRRVIFDMPAEVMEWIVMTSLDHRVSFW